jgi:acetolactate synthase-1/2/3 large subunit
MNSYRPVIMIGNGVRGNPELVEHLQSLGIPCLYTWMYADACDENHPTYCGRPGIFGIRASNLIQQKATHLYCFGARLDGEQVAYDYDRFAPNAEKHIYDVDTTEWQKFPKDWKMYLWNLTGDGLKAKYGTRKPDIIKGNPDWLAWCKALYSHFRPELEGCNQLADMSLPEAIKRNARYVDPFYLMTLLHDHSRPDDVFALGSSGNAPTVFFQSYKVKAGQRISNVCTIGSMGADIPMALGASLANPGKRVICVTGDGGFQMNAQELEVIRRLHLPITFFVLNNNGYNSIRVAQKARFGRVTGADPSSGLTLPRIEDIAHAYGMMYLPLRGADLPGFARCFDAAPMVVEVFVDPDWQQLPRVMASTVNGQLRTDDMQNMFPYLPEDELKEIMEA